MRDRFEPAMLERTRESAHLDEMPFGVIVVDAGGLIVDYNAYESELSGLAKARVLGRNFFRDVAPCTAIKEFEGRFREFLASDGTSIEPFEFTFAFSQGPLRVSIVFVRLNFATDRAAICVARRPDAADGAAYS